MAHGQVDSDDSAAIEKDSTVTLSDTSGAPVEKFGYSVSAKKYWRLCYQTMQLEYLDVDDATHPTWSEIPSSKKTYMKEHPFEPAAAKLLVAHKQRLNGELDFGSMSCDELSFLCNRVRRDPSFPSFVDYMEVHHDVEKNDFLKLWGSSESDQAMDLCDYFTYTIATGLSWDPLGALAEAHLEAQPAATAGTTPAQAPGSGHQDGLQGTTAAETPEAGQDGLHAKPQVEVEAAAPEGKENTAAAETPEAGQDGLHVKPPVEVEAATPEGKENTAAVETPEAGQDGLHVKPPVEVEAATPEGKENTAAAETPEAGQDGLHVKPPVEVEAATPEGKENTAAAETPEAGQDGLHVKPPVEVEAATPEGKENTTAAVPSEAGQDGLQGDTAAATAPQPGQTDLHVRPPVEAEAAPVHPVQETERVGVGAGQDELPSQETLLEVSTTNDTNKDSEEPANKKAKSDKGFFGQFESPMEKAPGMTKSEYDEAAKTKAVPKSHNISTFFPDMGTGKEKEKDTGKKDKKDKKDKKEEKEDKEEKAKSRKKKKEQEDCFLFQTVVISF